jgi:DNA-binding transcriptional regulator GbsR (MarR family)
MNLIVAKQQFIQSWGVLGSSWGINRTMAQIHALLLIAPEALNADEIMEALQISRGNANMNIRELINWGIVDKVLKPGDRKEIFSLRRKTYGKWPMRIMRERKKRELDPMITVIEQIKDVEENKKDTETKAFVDMVNQIQKFAKQADSALGGLIKADENWFTGTLLKLFK